MQHHQTVKLGLVWARFFSLLGWRWRVSRVPGFDLNLTIPCTHSECSGSHELIVRIDQGHREYFEKLHGELFDTEEVWSTPSPAIFGSSPEDTYWEMVHGNGGGTESIEQWVPDWKTLWTRAGGVL
jgi:hypothetical protein